ncbi:DMT family transporter [Candidatus Parcubacteria bacterium]|nr:MAG: DMT family transporter [Candidatus Parcubacteria bacterium]
MLLKNNVKGVIALILLAFGFASVAIYTRYLSGYLSLSQQLYLTLGAAFILSLFIFPRSLSVFRLRKIPKKDLVIMLFRITLGYIIGASLYREAIVLTKISNVTFIQSIPFASVFGFILFKEKFTIDKLLLLIVAYIGVILISVKDYSSVFTVGTGELFSFISAALFSLSYLCRKWQSNFLNDKEITQILLFMSFVTFFVISLVNGEILPTVSWQIGLFSVILLAGFFNVANNFLINFGFKNVKAVLAGNILTLEGIFALVLAFVFYQELPNLKEFIGGMLIIGSVIQMNRVESKVAT